MGMGDLAAARRQVGLQGDHVVGLKIRDPAEIELDPKGSQLNLSQNDRFGNDPKRAGRQIAVEFRELARQRQEIAEDFGGVSPRTRAYLPLHHACQAVQVVSQPAQLLPQVLLQLVCCSQPAKVLAGLGLADQFLDQGPAMPRQ